MTSVCPQCLLSGCFHDVVVSQVMAKVSLFYARQSTYVSVMESVFLA